MKATTLAFGLLLALPGLAAAVEDESALTIDLSGASDDVHAYYLKCQYGRDLNAGCGLVSVWEEVNGALGLQTTPTALVEKPDLRLTP